MQAVILAGGLATRLGDITRRKPKSLVEIAGKPFLQYQLEFLKANGIEDIVLCIGHLGEMIRGNFGDGGKYGVRLRYSVEDKPLGTAGAIKNAEPLLDDVFFTVYGDSFFTLDFPAIYRYFIERDKLGLMTVFKNHNLYDRSNTIVNREIVTKYEKNNVTTYMTYIDYGLNVFRREVFTPVPAGSFCELETVFHRLIANRELLAYEVKERFYEIGSLNGLNDFTNLVASSSSK